MRTKKNILLLTASCSLIILFTVFTVFINYYCGHNVINAYFTVNKGVSDTFGAVLVSAPLSKLGVFNASGPINSSNLIKGSFLIKVPIADRKDLRIIYVGYGAHIEYYATPALPNASLERKFCSLLSNLSGRLADVVVHFNLSVNGRPPVKLPYIESLQDLQCNSPSILSAWLGISGDDKWGQEAYRYIMRSLVNGENTFNITFWVTASVNNTLMSRLRSSPFRDMLDNVNLTLIVLPSVAVSEQSGVTSIPVPWVAALAGVCVASVLITYYVASKEKRE